MVNSHAAQLFMYCSDDKSDLFFQHLDQYGQKPLKISTIEILFEESIGTSQVRILELLLRRFPEIGIPNKITIPEMLVMKATVLGSTFLLQALFRHNKNLFKTPVKVVGNDITPLELALLDHRPVSLIKDLLEYGAYNSQHRTSYIGVTVVKYDSSDFFLILHALHNHGAQYVHSIALAASTRLRDAEKAGVLLEKKAILEVDESWHDDYMGAGALQIAVANMDMVIVSLLLAFGAKMRERDSYGRSAVDVLKELEGDEDDVRIMRNFILTQAAEEGINALSLHGSKEGNT